MSKTLIVLNPHAANGQAGKLWSTIEPILWDYLGELVIAVTQSSDDVAQHIHQAYEAGLTRVISIGGDGTNHGLINALVAHNEHYPDQPKMEYGMLPIGTGRDWARSQGIPFDIQAAAKWIAEAKPKAVDVGQVQLSNKPVYFLNVASVGISGDVVTRVEKSQRRPWSFLSATVRTLIDYQPSEIQIRLDGKDWYEGKSYLVAIANGTTFGRGMKVAPFANISDGLFDVVLVEGMSRLRALDALRRVYDGKHLDVKYVHHAQATSIDIMSQSSLLGMELDGEYARGQHLRFDIKPNMLNLLI
jgi:diacylglycerol kinase (ATP)